jgi:hypothetical protein
MERQWYVAARGGVLGPMESAAVLDLVRSGDARPDTQVCSTDEREWVEMRRVRELAAEMAREDAVALAQPHAHVPPPPPGEPWFYNVPVRRAVALHCVSCGWYSHVWHYRHQSWLRRRARIPGSAYDNVYALLLDEITFASARLGLPDPLGVLLARWTFIGKAQSAAEIVNQAVAPGASRPPMGFGEWAAIAGGLVQWAVFALWAVVSLVGS